MNNEHIYHVYPLGFSGANMDYNDGVMVHSLRSLMVLLPQLEEMKITTLLLGPIFESESHGYDTVDYRRVDRRLGNNEDLKVLVKACHNKGIKVMLDCVFNHIARSNEIFKDVKEKRENSSYAYWIKGIDFASNNGNNDGFSYENWDGHNHLVKLDLDNHEVVDYLVTTACLWMDEFNIDGLRMDAADVMSKGFLSRLSYTLKEKNHDFKLIGEVVHGNYNDWIHHGNLDGITNYEAYKGFYSSLNDANYYEIGYTLNRQFGHGGIYDGKHMYNFVDNHDVNRVASRLKDQKDLYPLYIMLYTIPGCPTVYYGSEYGLQGKKKQDTDTPLRPKWDHVEKKGDHPIYQTITKLADIRSNNSVLQYGDYKQVHIDHEVIGYERTAHDDKSYVFINAKDHEVSIPVPRLHGQFYDLLNNEHLVCEGQIQIYSNWGRILIPA